MMPPFIVFPTNRIAHFVEVSLYLFYLAQQVNLLKINSFYIAMQKLLIFIMRLDYTFIFDDWGNKNCY